MATPTLIETTGTRQSTVFIRDVVQRIKCELSDAIDKRLDQPGYSWLRGWTAHADLTLTVNENAGLMPTGGYTHLQGNQVNLDAGPNTFPATAARAVFNQFLTVNVGANLTGQAVRTETVSFTLSLDELSSWRRNIDDTEKNPNYPESEKICNLGNSNGLSGNLGLTEWIESAILPVVKGDLKAGIHSNTTAKATVATVPKASAPSTTIPGASKLTAGSLRVQLSAWEEFLTEISILQLNLSSTQEIQKTIATIRSTMQSSIKAAANYKYILEKDLEERYKQAKETMQRDIFYTAQCNVMSTKLTKDIADANIDLSTLIDGVRTEEDDIYLSVIPNTDFKKNGPDTYRKLSDIMFQLEMGVSDQNNPDIKESRYAGALVECAKIESDLLALSDSIPKQADPPIDALQHSVAFFVSGSANVTPSWTLLQWKGPGQNPNLLSASGVRTHQLNITIGPPSGAPAVGTDAQRLINLQEVIRNINGQ